MTPPKHRQCPALRYGRFPPSFRIRRLGGHLRLCGPGRSWPCSLPVWPDIPREGLRCPLIRFRGLGKFTLSIHDRDIEVKKAPLGYLLKSDSVGVLRHHAMHVDRLKLCQSARASPKDWFPGCKPPTYVGGPVNVSVDDGRVIGCEVNRCRMLRMAETMRE